MNANTEKVDLLRAIAAWLTDTELPEDVHVVISQGPALSLFPHSPESLTAVRRLVGPVQKESGSQGMTLSGLLTVDGHIAQVPVTLWPPEGTCSQVQVGVERRPVMVESGTYEQVPVYEWECGPILTEVAAAREQVPA